MSVTNQPLPETLYHYTDIYALQGIWEKGELWGTESFYLNDTTELIGGLDAVRKAVAQKQADISKGEAEEVDSREAFRRQLEMGSLRAAEKLLTELRSSASYVISLSEKPDQLSQWRAYAKAGYCIGFSTAILKASLKISQSMGRVNYLDSENIEILASRVVKLVDQDRSRLAPDNAYEEAVREYRLSDRLTRESAFFKDESFVEEEEVRIVDTAMFPDFHTAGKYGMTPRIRVPLDAGAITSITVGPGPHTEQRLRSLRQYVARVQFKNDQDDLAQPEVLKSKVPYRDW